MTFIASPKENNFKDLGGEFVLVDESQKNVMQLLDQLGIGTEKVPTCLCTRGSHRIKPEATKELCTRFRLNAATAS